LNRLRSDEDGILDRRGASSVGFGTPVSVVIAGPRTEEQWDGYLKALDYRFTREDEALIDCLVVSGHPSTPGFNDPACPIEGRRARTGRNSAT